MTNRIEQNVIIIDSAMGNSYALTSAGSLAQYPQFRDCKIQSIYLANTTCALSLAGIDTSNVIVTLSNGSVGMIFPLGLRVTALKVPAVSGTAYIYLA